VAQDGLFFNHDNGDDDDDDNDKIFDVLRIGSLYFGTRVITWAFERNN
jgi:hypothetical protein